MGKEHTLLVFAIGIGLVMLAQPLGGYFRTVGQGSVAVVLSKQDGEIIDLNAPRKISEQRMYKVSKVAFPESDLLRHKDLGELPYSQNYYLDLTGEFKVLSAAEFEFRITSDDGFKFYVDDAVRLENPGPRRFETSKVELSLSEGKHRFKLEYFQQGGQAGLEATYKQKGARGNFFLGENSPLVKWE